MKLTPQHLAEVVQALSGTSAGSKGSEKRRAARMEVQGNVVVAPCLKDGSLGQSYTAITRDISFVGLGLLQSKPLTQGQEIIVRLPRGTKEALFTKCTTMHVRQLAEGLFVIGAEFLSLAEIREEELLGRAGDTEMQRMRQLILN